MISNILTRIFGSRNERLLKQYGAGRPRRSTRSSRRSPRSPTRRCAAKTGEFERPRRRRRDARRRPARGVRGRPRGRQARAAACATSTCSCIGGIALHNGKIAEMRTGEGKTLVATLPGVPERARRQGRPHRHGERLPRAARRRLDGPHLPVPRHDRRRQPVADGARRQAGRVRAPTSPTARTTSSASTTCATTWCSRPSRARAARPHLRDRRRGRLDPDRRGAHAAHHLRARPTTTSRCTTG